MASSDVPLREQPINSSVGAVVLAAGLSLRMGRPKMLLPWAGTTVIGWVVATLCRAHLSEILVVSGGLGAELELALGVLPARVVPNPDFANGEMLSSLKMGLSQLSQGCKAALIVLGDQPQIELGVVLAVLHAFQEQPDKLVVPSYNLRRGHPWVLPYSLWSEIMDLKPPGTPRDFLNARAGRIHYLPVATPSIMMDLDTPEDYRKYHPG
jgi:molybdenum cofactor cytidylyltransferase